MQLRSAEEAHVSSPSLIVGIASGSEHPLCPCLSRPVCTEEVVKDGWVDWKHCFFIIVVIVGRDFGALVEMGLFSKSMDKFCIVVAKFKQALIVTLEWSPALRCEKPIELLFLIAGSVFFDDDATSQMLQEI